MCALVRSRWAWLIGVVVLLSPGCRFDPSSIRPDTQVCGNGVADPGEECDQADLGGASCASLNLGDGTLACRADCSYETLGCSSQAVCGNGQVEGSEVCDDGNVDACDGCSADCLSDESCGNGVTECTEACDDGNTTDGDGCDSSCQFEIPPNCGDGTQDPGEACDDGNTDACDGCSPSCQIESCGNGITECAEICDDGNTTDCDGCSADCMSDESCGNGVTECAEQCDDGANDPGDGCGPGCLNEECGNLYLDPGEVCDDGNTVGGDGCSADCMSDESCGNSIVDTDAGEECDDGNSVETDDCLSSCLAPTCGDGHIWAGNEDCESGQVNSDCVTEGYAGGNLGCGPNCDWDISGCTRFDGQPCTYDAQCVGGICWEENSMGMPGGVCTSNCTTSSCDPGFNCVNVDFIGDRCFQDCTTYTDCRPGYICWEDPWNYSDLMCYALCTSDNDCPDTGQCNEYTGLCGSQTNNSLNDTGESCSNNGHCRGYCWTGSANGYCVTPCNRNDPVCPGDGICSDLFGSAGDLGWCLDGCQTGADCPRPEYICEPNPYGTGDICNED